MKERSEILAEDKWSVESLYPSLSAWEEDFKKVVEDKKLKILSFNGRLHESAEVFKEALELILDTERRLEKLYTYAHLRHDEDVTQDAYKSAFMRITSALYDFKQQTAWFEPEILLLPQEKISHYLQLPLLEPYRFFIERIIRLRAHMLSADKEALLAMAGKALQASPKAFSALNNADIKFDPIKDSQGKTYELTHALYQLYLRSKDRTLRENAFKGMLGEYKDLENTLSELIYGEMEGHVFNTKARYFDSSLQAALFPSNIPETVYTSLIHSVREGLSTLHRYIDLRKKILNVSELHLYDMYVPLVQEVDIKMDYKEAETLVIESVAPLGVEYQSMLRKGLAEDRWVDRYENKSKRSGAYSSGCYDSHPYILMNYRGVLRDVFTLAHEAGHSMHSLLSRKNQPYHYSQYTIFVAEVASTFNEELLMNLLLDKMPSKEAKIYLINEKIEDLRATFFRQTMFAEFELLLHRLVEEGIPLTPTLLKEKYLELNKIYFGPRTFIDQEIAIEWARIPHFYYNFYVYQYATGISAALNLAEKVSAGDKSVRDKYLNFLKSGGKDFPINLLKEAGVDMTTAAPVQSTLKKFDSLVSKLESLL